MKIIENQIFQNQIENNLDKIPLEAKKDFEKIKEIFDLEKIHIVGGFARDSILQVLYDYKFPLNDLDILIEDKNYDSKILEFKTNSKNRFGNLKLKYANFSIDSLDIEKIYFLQNKKDKNIESFLQGCDLTTSAIAYNLKTQKIFSNNALEDISKKEINFNFQNYLKIAPTLCRLILHSDKMNFSLGESSLNYIKRNYSQEQDKEILDYLNYKKIPHLFSFVKNQLSKL